MEDKKTTYFGGIKETAKSLLTGMGVTWKEYFTPKITEQYPENRKNSSHLCTSSWYIDYAP